MTVPDKRESQVGSLQTTDVYLRVAGREFLVQLYTALRSLKLYPLENPVVQKALDDIVLTADKIVEREAEIEIRVTGEFIFVNSTRLRLDLDNVEEVGAAIEQRLDRCRIGDPDPEHRPQLKRPKPCA